MRITILFSVLVLFFVNSSFASALLSRPPIPKDPMCHGACVGQGNYLQMTEYLDGEVFANFVKLPIGTGGWSPITYVSPTITVASTFDSDLALIYNIYVANAKGKIVAGPFYAEKSVGYTYQVRLSGFSVSSGDSFSLVGYSLGFPNGTKLTSYFNPKYDAQVTSRWGTVPPRVLPSLVSGGSANIIAGDVAMTLFQRNYYVDQYGGAFSADLTVECKGDPNKPQLIALDVESYGFDASMAGNFQVWSGSSLISDGIGRVTDITYTPWGASRGKVYLYLNLRRMPVMTRDSKLTLRITGNLLGYGSLALYLARESYSMSALTGAVSQLSIGTNPVYFWREDPNSAPGGKG